MYGNDRVLMVKIRLQRHGTKKRPFYRVVAADSRFPRDGRFLEILGFYNPVSHTKDMNLRAERIQYWMGKGAQPTDTVKRLLQKQNIIASEN